MSDTARALLEVTAGVIPGHPIHECTKQWAITSEEWQSAQVLPQDTPDAKYGPHPSAALLAQRQGEAQGYAALLMLQPDRYNWVKLQWIWL